MKQKFFFYVVIHHKVFSKNRAVTLVVLLMHILISQLSGSQDDSVSGEDIDNAMFYCFEGVEQAAEGNFTDALEQFRMSLKYDPCFSEVMFYIQILTQPEYTPFRQVLIKSVYDLKKGRNDRVDSLICNYFGSDTSSYIYNILAGIYNQRIRNIEQALIYYSAAVKINNNDAYIIYQRGQLFLSINDFKNAEADFSRAINLNSCDFRNRYSRGIARYNLGKYNQAISDFETAMQRAPRLRLSLQESLVICEAYNMRGIRRIESNHFQEALEDFNEAISLYPNFSEPYLNRGIVFRHLNMLPAAVQDFNQAIILNEKYTEAYFNRGLAFKGVQQYEQAIKDLYTVLAFDTQHARAYFYLGEIYFDQADYYAAITAYTRSIELDSGYVWTFYKRAQAYDRLRKFPGAIKDYDYFFESAPDSFVEHKVEAWERSRLLKKWLDQVRDK